MGLWSVSWGQCNDNYVQSGSFDAAGVKTPKMGWTWSEFVSAAREIYEKQGYRQRMWH